MKIGCLQFAPQVGDISNNLNRADAVLNKSQDLNDLDLLVLPELAFTGYNFRSLAHISPYLEPSGSGISSLWARTTALKLNCNVIVGYPEKVDVTKKWPTSPEFYNSAIMASRDGETIGNYRKSFLYATDETWALEGNDGFFECDLPDLGTVAMGICMDINPYKFEAPWDAFEFAFHILEVQANVVIVTMAWLTREDPRAFTQLPHEPDLETLNYWIQRLEPVIHRENGEETIAVFCNRTGTEGECAYAGTSAVFGIKNGEVNLYGVLGRGVKELLVVDTEARPFAKIVQADAIKNEPIRTKDKGIAAQPHMQESRTVFSATTTSSTAMPYTGGLSQDTRSQRSSTFRDRCEEWDVLSNTASAGSTPSVRSQTFHFPTKVSLPKLELQIPSNSQQLSTFNSLKSSISATLSPNQKKEDIPTPTAPSPTPLSLRPSFSFEAFARPTAETLPAFVNTMAGGSVVKLKRTGVPITPPLKSGSADNPGTSTPIVEAPPSPPVDTTSDPSSLPAQVNYLSDTDSRGWDKRDMPASGNDQTPHNVSAAASAEVTGRQTADALFDEFDDDVEISTDDEDDDNSLPPFATGDDMYSEVQQELQSLLLDNHEQNFVAPTFERPQSTKSRNASCPRLPDSFGYPVLRPARSTSQSNANIAGAGLFGQKTQSTMKYSDSPIYFRADSGMGSQLDQASTNRQTSENRYGQQQKAETPKRRLDSPMVHTSASLPFSRDAPGGCSTSADSKVWRMPSSQSTSRPVSRGRQPFSKINPTNGNFYSSSAAAPARRAATVSIDRERRLSNNLFIGPYGRPAGAVSEVMTDRASSVASSVSWLFGTPPPASVPQPSIDPDDEIVAMINLISGACPVHRNSRQARSSPRSHDQHGQQEQDGAHAQPASATPDRRQPPQSQSTPVAADNIYEVILPPHIRDLVESFSSSKRHPPSPFHTGETSKGRSTPKFNPPTPTAMQFSSSEHDDDRPSSVAPLEA